MRLVYLLAVGSLLSAQDGVFRAGVSLVRVDAQVTRGDEVIGNLNREDFRVFDNGKEQTIMHFAREEAPMDLLLVLDTSGSMRNSISEVARVTRQALSKLRPGDRVGVTQFTARFRTVIPLTSDFEAVRAAIEELCSKPFRGGTDIMGGIHHGSQFLLKEKRGENRRSVLIITDGVGKKELPEKRVLTQLWEADAVLNGLIVPNDYNGRGRFSFTLPNPSPDAQKIKLDKMAGETGGEVMESDEPAEAFERMVNRIRMRYSLHYALPAGKKGDERSVKVELSASGKKAAPGGRVKARKGYLRPE
jgi:VWFA-related protein